ncbi:YjeO family protein [Mixta calida]|nr:YjeO family protein [Mixta calida]
MNWKKLCLALLYSGFCFFNIAYLSYFKEEQYIGDEGINTVCDAMQYLVVDDSRDFTAPLTLLMILPLLWFSLCRKHRALSLMLLSGNDSNLLIVFYVQIMPDDFVMQLHRF